MDDKSLIELDFMMASPQKDKAVVREIFDKLVEHYEQPDGFYHTLHHIASGLRVHYRLFNEPLPPTLLFPWMYHDYFYDSKAHDNEERSGAQWMRDAIPLGFTVDEAEEGNAYILATDPSAEPLSVLNDMDLAELGAAPDVFDNNTALIRQEYAWVEPEVWKKGRIAILIQFLKRDRLYITHQFSNAFTEPAIENLKRAILKLSDE